MKAIVINTRVIVLVLFLYICSLSSCYHRRDKPGSKTSVQPFLTGTWERKTTKPHPLVNVFNDSGLMRTYQDGKLIETLWFRLDSSRKEKVIIFSETSIPVVPRKVLDTSSTVFGLLMRSYGHDTVQFQHPLETFSKRIPTDWDEELPSNTYVLIRRK